MKPEYHSTAEYHLHGLDTLGWELTVCNSLSVENSPCRKILKNDGSYGRLLYGFLERSIPPAGIRRVLEVGGGYGRLMRDFFSLRPDIQALMIDLSPVLLDRQRRVLGTCRAEFVQSDFLEVDPACFQGIDLAVFNENLGDFPMLLNIEGGVFDQPVAAGGPLRRVLEFYARYDLDRPECDPFHCNLGALEAVEKVCTAGIPYIFLSEHSCEAVVPEPHRSYIRILSAGNPERIALRGHDEYTIQFSNLQKIAARLGYDFMRGPLADFIEIDFSDRVRFILGSRLRMNDDHEIIRHFVEDLFKYEYLLLSKRNCIPADIGAHSPTAIL